MFFVGSSVFGSQVELDLGVRVNNPSVSVLIVTKNIRMNSNGPLAKRFASTFTSSAPVFSISFSIELSIWLFVDDGNIVSE